MKVLILAGGFGTRLSEETDVIPKPMLEIGSKPILWHIMKTYSHYGFNDFVILLGYKGFLIKQFFALYHLYQSNITIDLSPNQAEVHANTSEPWKVTLLDTGVKTMTGGRIQRAQEFIGDEPFMLTYGDGLADVNINELIECHKSHKKIVTMTAVQPASQFGAVDIDNSGCVQNFIEKPQGEKGWINGGFFVCQPEVFDYIVDDDKTIFEQDPLRNMAKDGQLCAYKHQGFWKCMDTQRDRVVLNKMWKQDEAKWKIWD